VKKITSGLGHIPSNEDRTIFEIRSAYVNMLDQEIGFPIFNDFECNFIGNNLNGYSFANILEGIINDYELWCKSTRTYNLDFWFDLSAFAQMYKMALKFYDKTNLIYTMYERYNDNDGTQSLGLFLPKKANSLINANGNYEYLKRSDKKLAPISLVMPYVELPTIDIGMDSIPLENVASRVEYTETGAKIPMNYKLESNRQISYIMKIDKNYAFHNEPTLYASEKGAISILRSFIIHAAKYTPVNLNTKYTVPTIGNNLQLLVNEYTPNQFIAVMRDVIAVIRFCESENNSMNIKGNIDGLKINEYEQILSDQMSYLNNLSDKVNIALIQEKLAGQELKNKTLENIAVAKTNLEAVKKQKRTNIALLRQTLAKIK